jgi:hypothetical protein
LLSQCKVLVFSLMTHITSLTTTPSLSTIFIHFLARHVFLKSLWSDFSPNSHCKSG